MGRFVDQQAESAFRASFFRANMRLHLAIYVINFRPDIIFRFSSLDPAARHGTNVVVIATYVLLLLILFWSRRWLHGQIDHSFAQLSSLCAYTSYVLIIFGGDTAMILTGATDIKRTVQVLSDPQLTALGTLHMVGLGVLQAAHAPSLTVDTTLVMTVLVNQVLNGLMVFRSNRIAMLSTLGTWFTAYSAGLASTWAYASVMRNSSMAKKEQLMPRCKEQVAAAYAFHELRNHQNVQAGVLKVLMEEQEAWQGKCQQSELASMVANALVHSQHGCHVIENMLNFTKLQAGKLELAQVPFELVEMLNECVTLVKHMLLKESTVELLVQLEVGSTTTKLIGPVTLLKQILVNLLTNAIKYTSDGYVLIRATVDGHTIPRAVGPPGTARSSGTVGAKNTNMTVDNSMAEPPPPIVLHVEDTGCGIPKERLSTVFEPFEQGFKHGTGLGLPFCKEALAFMGSHLTVSSLNPCGTMCSFPLVCEAAPHESVLAASIGTSTHVLTPLPTAVSTSAVTTSAPFVDAPRVLLADDLKINRMILAAMLKRVWKDVVIEQVGSGEQALEALQSALQMDASFDYAFLDEHYSGDSMTGIEVTCRYRETEAARRLLGPQAVKPVIIVGCTGSSGVDRHDEAAQAAGQDLVIGKPLPDVHQLKKLLLQAWHTRRPHADPTPASLHMML